MADWKAELAKINPDFMLDSPSTPVRIATSDIIKAMQKSGMSPQEIAQELQTYMNKYPHAEPDKPKPAVLTLQQILDMMSDPTQHTQLKAAWASMSDDQKKLIIDQVRAAEQKMTAQAEYHEKLISPVLKAIDNIESIANSALPKKSKMLDVIDQLNKILPSPALELKDEKDVGYGDKLIHVLNTQKLKFGTTNTPGDKFVQLLAASINANKPVQMPVELLEGDLHRLREMAGLL